MGGASRFGGVGGRLWLGATIAAAAALWLVGARLIPHQVPAAPPPQASSGSGGALARPINAMLARTVGPDRAYVAINAVVDANASSSASLAYGGGTALTNQTASARSTGYSSSASSTAWARNTTITHSTIAPGGIRRMQVALLVDSTLPKQTVAGLRAAVAAAAGLVPARGDRLSVARVRFNRASASKSSPAAAALAPLAAEAVRYGPVALLALGFLGFAAVGLRRREGEALLADPLG